MSIAATCAHCGHELRAKEKYAGKRVKCPGCGQPVHVPAAAPEPVADAASPAARPAAPPGMDDAEPGPVDIQAGAGATAVAIKCPKCLYETRIKSEFAGRRVKCPKCRQTIAVPEPTDPVPPKRPANAFAVGTLAPSPLPSFAPDTLGQPAGSPAASLLEPDEAPWTTPHWSDDDDDLPAGFPPMAAGYPMPPLDNRSSVFGEPQPAGALRRMGGYIIDVLPTLLLFPLPLIPIIGPLMFGIALLIYWLLRDIRGASLGKWAMGTEIWWVNGGPARGGRCVMRNLTLAIGPTISMLLGFLSVLALLIPPLLPLVAYGGLLVVAAINFFVILTELIILLVTGRRFGDRFAGTRVVMKPVAPGQGGGVYGAPYGMPAR